MNADTTLSSKGSLFADVPEPVRAIVILNTGLGDDERLSITIVKLLKDFRERPIDVLTAVDLSPARMMPLIMEVVVQTEYVERLMSAAKFRLL